MRTELLGQEQNIVRIKVEFEASEFMEKLNEVIRDVTRNANIPGFRKGHIPRKMLEMRFGKDNLHREALEKMLPDAMKQVTDDYDLDIMDTPSLEIDDIAEGQPVTCELTFEVRPEVELPEFEDIEAERLRQEVKDETVDEMTAQFREQFSTLNPVERAVGDGDVVSVSFVTHVLDADGKEPSPADEPTSSNIDLSLPSVRPEVKNALLGKSKGDEADAEFEIESDHYDASMAGKKIRYEMTISEVNEKILPELGPEFFKKVLETDTETEEDFRKEVRRRVLEHQEREETNRVIDRAITAIIERAVLEIPDNLVERQSAYLKEQDETDVTRRLKTTMEEYLNKNGMEKENYDLAIQERAKAALRRTLVMDELGKKLEIEVKPEDIEAEISRLSAMYGIERSKVRANYYKNEDNMAQLSNGLRYDKIAGAILDKVKVREVDKLSDAPNEGNEEPSDVNENNGGAE